ncbi:hypothetical protein D9619_012266 [Psilocybe cf. subviscida]|uniref:Major facilitator superfamily (MFS) profile domain-containing protein n=1 Tax=Psilocybe cf. subviscida TaxID=2480587 RepID=A0A8H5B7A9_9AGAR|nr:hypothetical protein D9619_012266 [Psilocybe cf. subviscida]
MADILPGASKRQRTPLPADQIAILLFLRFCESASMFVIFPFLNELMASVTGGDSSRVGYYAGIMESVRQLLSLVCVMYWSRTSDRIGRKPVLLIGMFALAVSTTSFGFSKTFLALIVSRCIFTAFNSNAGVIKSVVGEITDSTNSADAFALLHVPWAAGSSFGALIGGTFSRPADQFPSLFHSKFWIDHPYFLPCAIMGCVALFACWLIAAFLRESVYIPRPSSTSTEDPLTTPLLPSKSTKPSLEITPPNAADAPVPFSALIRNTKVLLPIACYVSLAALHAASNALQPLFLAMPVAIGGLGLPPRTVGYILAAYGVTNAAVQTLLLGRAVRRVGVKRVLVCAMAAFAPVFAFAPVLNLVARACAAGGDVDMPVMFWALLACQLGCSLVMELGYGEFFLPASSALSCLYTCSRIMLLHSGCVYIFITAGSPNKRSLGATHGLAQTLVSIGRIAAPALASSMLSASIQYDLLGGYAVYVLFVILAAGAVGLASYLPRRVD